MVSDEREKELLDIHGMHMADSLMVKARDLNLDLRPLLDTGYGWFEWLTTTLGEQVRNDVFWNLSHAYAAAVVLPIGNDIDTVYEARRWQVARHAIHLIGRVLYPPQDVRWHDEERPGASYWQRSWPCVQEINNALITVYYVARADRPHNGWRGTLYAISIEHLTEFDWLEFTDSHVNRYEPYTLNDVLFDFVLEGQGACLWTSHDKVVSYEQAIAFTKERAQYMANNFEIVMMQFQGNGIRRLDQLRAVGGAYTWVELPEYRKLFSLNKTDRDQAERHSIRVYQYGGSRYTLDRCLGLDPPGYVLYYQDKRHTVITPVIKVEGQELWGEGMAWARAESKAKEAVQQRTWRDI